MIDERRLVRGVALQILHELDMTDHDPNELLRFQDSSDLFNLDARLLGYLALRERSQESDQTPSRELIKLDLLKPQQERTQLEQVLLDILIEHEAHLEIIPESDAEAWIEHEILVPTLEEFDLTIKSTDELFSLERQHALKALVLGVWEQLALLDEILNQHTQAWTVEQLGIIDRNILRIALYEIIFLKEIPLPVAINEAVELAKYFGSETTGVLVNGILGGVATESKRLIATYGPKPESAAPKSVNE